MNQTLIIRHCRLQMGLPPPLLHNHLQCKFHIAAKANRLDNSVPNNSANMWINNQFLVHLGPIPLPTASQLLVPLGKRVPGVTVGIN